MKVALLIDEACAKSLNNGSWALTERHELRIERSLKRSGHEVTILPVSGDLSGVERSLGLARPNVVFNLTEEYRGARQFDALVADFVLACGFRMTGNKGDCLRLCRDKAISKMLLKSVGISVPRFLAVRQVEELRSDFLLTAKYPVLVKPIALDGSDLISRQSLCHNRRAAIDRARWLLSIKKEPAIIEEYIEGKELTIPFTAFNEIQLYPPRELKLPRNYPRKPLATVSIKERRDRRRTQPRFVRARLLPNELIRISEVVRATAAALTISSYARLDLIIKTDGTPVVLEANPNCGLAPRAFSIPTLNASIYFDRLINDIISNAS